MKHKESQQPNWQPLTMLPSLADAIDGMLCEADIMLSYIKRADEKSDNPDDAILGSLIKCYGRQKKDLWLYKEQAVRWKKEDNLTENQHQEIIRLENQLKILDDILGSVLSLADKLKEETDERVPERDDVEPEKDLLPGEIKP